MSHPLRIAISLLVLTSCLDASQGTQAGDALADVGPDVAETTACPTAGAALELITRDPDQFALGPCGKLAYWSERSPRELRFLSEDHDLIATYPDPNAFSGTIAISRSGDRAVAASVRSDLGFGDTWVARFPESANVTLETTLHFDGAPSRDPYLPFIVGDHLFHLSSDAPSTLFALDLEDLATTTSRPLAELDREWLDGSTVRTRDGFVVTGDGTRVVVVSECVSYTQTPCAATVRRVIDMRGDALVAPTRWTDPLVGPGSIVAATTEDGAVFLDAAGATHSAAGHTPVAVMSDHVLTTRDGALFAHLGDAPPTRLATSYRMLTIDPAGRSAAFLDDTSALVIWADQQLVHTDTTLDRIMFVHGGATLAVSASSTLVITAAGALATTFETDCVRNAKGIGEALFFELCSTPNDELHRFDLTRNEDHLVAEGHDFDYQVDLSGTHIAFAYLPLSATPRELHAGRFR